MRLNRTAGALTPYGFEARTHNHAGSPRRNKPGLEDSMNVNESAWLNLWAISKGVAAPCDAGA